MRPSLLRALVPASLVAIAACGGADAELTGRVTAPARPAVRALSTYGASLGTLIEVYGSDFPAAKDATAELVFRGTFVASDGAEMAVDRALAARIVDASTLRWTSFGPYDNPFAPGSSQTGRFRGAVFARTLPHDGGAAVDGAPLELELDVEPSIVVRELDPVTASCNGPAKRALGGAAYHLRVEAIGFTPAAFTYTVSAPALGAAPLAIRHLATGRFDLAGERGDLVFPEVPDGVPSYRAIVTVEALGTDGETRSTAFAIGVHRPLELFYDGNVDVAEILAPVPVSACIPGGEAGRDVTYGESASETRQRSYDVSWNESWLSSHTVATSGSETVGASETNGVGFATTDGQSWSWSLGTTVSGELGLSELVKVGVSASAGIGGGGSTSVERSGNRSASLSAETTTTDTESATVESGGGRGESFSWQVSSTESVSRSFGGRVIAGHYGVFYRQAMRLLRRGQLVTYNQCGAATVVGDVDFSDWAWSPDLALARACPPLPASNLPEARCMIPPCSAD